MKPQKPDIEYTLQQRFSAEHVQLQFNGTLDNQPVVWQAHIRTLHDYYLNEIASSPQHATQKIISVQAQSFIDITANNNTPSLLVAINLPVIDHAAILRTIIMIRQYKRLTPGRHQYGDMATFHFDNK